MAEENPLSNNNEGAKPKTIRPRAAAKPKPLVEGINSPHNTSDVIFVKPTLTEQEKRVISESGGSVKPPPRLLSQKAVERASKKDSGIISFLLWLLFFLVLGFGIYEVYGWYAQRHSQPAQNTSTSPAPSPNRQTLQVNPATSAPQTATTTPSSTPASIVPTPPPQVKQLQIKSTPTGYLNVRSQPSSGGKIVAQVHPGEVYTYTNSKSGWYQIVLPNGQSGWVSGQYVTLQ